MSRQSRLVLLSLLAFASLAVPSSARQLQTNSHLTLPRKCSLNRVGSSQSYTQILGALEGTTIPFRYAMLNDAKRDYTFVVFDDSVLRKRNDQKQPDDALQAVSPSLAITPDNHRGGPPSDDQPVVVTTAAPTSLSGTYPSISISGDTPAHSRKYLESKK